MIAFLEVTPVLLKTSHVRDAAFPVVQICELLFHETLSGNSLLAVQVYICALWFRTM